MKQSHFKVHLSSERSVRSLSLIWISEFASSFLQSRFGCYLEAFLHLVYVVPSSRRFSSTFGVATLCVHFSASCVMSSRSFSCRFYESPSFLWSSRRSASFFQGLVECHSYCYLRYFWYIVRRRDERRRFPVIVWNVIPGIIYAVFGVLVVFAMIGVATISIGFPGSC